MHNVPEEERPKLPLSDPLIYPIPSSKSSDFEFSVPQTQTTNGVVEMKYLMVVEKVHEGMSPINAINALNIAGSFNNYEVNIIGNTGKRGPLEVG